MGRLEVHQAVCGMLATNVYFAVNRETKECLLIDPGEGSSQTVLSLCEKENLQVKAILLTHGHFDHMGCADALRKHFSVPIIACAKEEALLNSSMMNVSEYFHSPATLQADSFVREGEECSYAGLDFRVLHTPGHTGGSCCYYFPEDAVLFSGDTLFFTSYGRTDLYTSSNQQMIVSIHRLLRELPDETKVYPGHMEETSIGFEKKYNPLAE